MPDVGLDGAPSEALVILVVLGDQLVRARRQLHPVAAHHILVDHKAQCKAHVALIRQAAAHGAVPHSYAHFQHAFTGCHQVGRCHDDLQERLLLSLLIAPHRCLDLLFNAHNSRAGTFGLGTQRSTQGFPEIIDVLCPLKHAGLFDVEVWLKAVHKGAHTLACFVDSKQPHDRHILFRGIIVQALSVLGDVVVHIKLLEDYRLCCRVYVWAFGPLPVPACLAQLHFACVFRGGPHLLLHVVQVDIIHAVEPVFVIIPRTLVVAVLERGAV
mmetsp:Transcript_6082/g.16188  ORF Transcript_6082/g.16188 Transcript_6082/m.16188 type:complete len:270 (+) Transcript_6082:2792-3601(+)